MKGRLGMLKKYLQDVSGATAIEYGLIAALISVSIIAGYSAIGGSLNEKWGQTATTLKSAGSDYLGGK